MAGLKLLQKYDRKSSGVSKCYGHALLRVYPNDCLFPDYRLQICEALYITFSIWRPTEYNCDLLS